MAAYWVRHIKSIAPEERVGVSVALQRVGYATYGNWSHAAGRFIGIDLKASVELWRSRGHIRQCRKSAQARAAMARAPRSRPPNRLIGWCRPKRTADPGGGRSVREAGAAPLAGRPCLVQKWMPMPSSAPSRLSLALLVPPAIVASGRSSKSAWPGLPQGRARIGGGLLPGPPPFPSGYEKGPGAWRRTPYLRSLRIRRRACAARTGGCRR